MCVTHVVTERLRFLEAELKDQRQLLATKTAEKDNLQEDMWQIKAAKKQSDEVSGCRAGIQNGMTVGLEGSG